MLAIFSKKVVFSLAARNIRFLFSDQRTQILKTYLQVIPPHRIHEIVENKQHRLEGLIKKMGGEEGEQGQLIVKKEDVHALSKHIKKRINLIPIPLLTKIMQIAVRGEQSQHSLELRKIYTKIMRTIKANAEAVPLEDLIDFVYKLVKAGKKQYQVMKEVQKVIIQERVKINYMLIRKILWAYTHTNIGSSVLYAHVSKTLTIGQYQFEPLQLAESAYFLSKVSENAQGGYGVFSIAQKHVQAHLMRMQFSTLVKSALFLLTQNLGSNKFQEKLQQALMRTYPDKDKLKINDLVMLLKSTSGYFFKYNENALLSKLKTSTIRMAHYATLEQFQDIVWSWGRLGKGDKQLWECIEKEVLRHAYQLKPRQLAFIYYSVCNTNLTTDNLLRHLQTAFLRLDLKMLNQHILIKFLLGMQRKKQYSNQAFQKVSSTLSVKIPELTNNQFMMFLKILNESEIDYTNKNEIGSVISTLSTIGTKLLPKIYTFKLPQIAELAFLWIKLQIKDDILIQKCLFHLQSVKDIPKICFIKSMFIFTMREQYHKSVQFLPILQELLKYGPIGYFFSPYEFPLLAYCVLHLHVQGTNLHINPHLVQQVKSTLKGINPVMLNQFVRKGYDQAIRLTEMQKTDK